MTFANSVNDAHHIRWGVKVEEMKCDGMTLEYYLHLRIIMVFDPGHHLVFLTKGSEMN